MDQELNLSNVPRLTVGRITELLEQVYGAALDGHLPMHSLPAVMLWGPPGVGKSQAVRQLADRLAERTGKDVRVTDVRLLLFNPIDLRGIPTANADKTAAVWLRPQIFRMDPGSEVLNILFLDEISAAPPSVQAAAYQITLDRTVGEHRLPDNCIVIAAGNRVTDKSVSFKMPKALANRLHHIEVEGSFASWQNWALKAGIHPKVLGFLCSRADLLFGFDAKNDDLAFATPRSWEMVSNLLNHVCDDVEAMYPLIAGLVGSGTALEFRSWCHLSFRLPKTEDIFMGKVTEVPKETDLLYAIICSMIAYAKDHKDDHWQIGNSLRYAAGFPADFISLLTDHYAAMSDNYGEVLRSLPEYYELSAKRGRVRNGQV